MSKKKKSHLRKVEDPRENIVAYKSHLNIEISMDENRIPIKIRLDAPDEGLNNRLTPAIFLSMWDDEAPITLMVDTWVKKMPLESMRLFVHQTLDILGDTYRRATGDEEMGEAIEKFSEYFAYKLNLYK
ncbi:MAG: gliding motility protein GldC [Flavobacteriaceae bacterium]|nr:gliding motility protein GldC [Flavobacteriaceae bacterium]